MEKKTYMTSIMASSIAACTNVLTLRLEALQTKVKENLDSEHVLYYHSFVYHFQHELYKGQTAHIYDIYDIYIYIYIYKENRRVHDSVREILT